MSIDGLGRLAADANLSLPPVLRWYLEQPRLDDVVEGPQWQNEAARAIDDPLGTVEPTLIHTTPRVKWDYNISLPLQARVATPAIIIGAFLLLLGTAGCITSLSGWRIPGFEFLMEEVSISVAFSLTLVRAGIHMINNGVMGSRVKNRWRQEAMISYKLMRIEDALVGLPEETRKERLLEVARLNARLPAEQRLDNLLGPNFPHAKQNTDLPSGREASFKFRQEIQAIFEQHPVLDLPERHPLIRDIRNQAPHVDESEDHIITPMVQQLEDAENDPLHADAILDVNHANAALANIMRPIIKEPTFANKWYDFWYNRVIGKGNMPGLGVIDIMVGQVMLVTALSGFMFMAKPEWLPKGLEVLAKDPYLTVTFGFILIGHWISCTQSGYRMLTLDKRESKRAAIEEDFQLIDLGIEKRRVEEFYQYLKKSLAEASLEVETRRQIEDKLDYTYMHFLESLPKDLDARLAAAKKRWEDNEMPPEGCMASRLHKFGKWISPKLATPTILLGILITFFGLACFGMSITDHIPDFFKFLASKDSTVSILFSSGLVIAGIDAMYRGTSISQRDGKDEWKKTGTNARKALLKEFFPDEFSDVVVPPPPLEQPIKMARQRRRNISGEVDVPEVPGVDRSEAQEKMAESAYSLSKGWYSLWDKTIKVLWVPDMLLAGFLLSCSIAGLLWCCGAPVPPSMEFIIKDPSFSAIFCFSLLAVAIDAGNTTWRIMSYHSRKKEDGSNLGILEKCWAKLAPPAESPRLDLMDQKA